MTNITRVTSSENTAEIADILREYIAWLRDEMQRIGAPDLDPDDLVAQTLNNLPAYLPPHGHLLTARNAQGLLLGVGFLKQIRADAVEIKRLYVRPAARGTGLGRTLVDRLLDTARSMNAAKVLIDTGRFMTQAQALYRSLGFKTVERYAESENDPAFAPYLVYMELTFPHLPTAPSSK